MKCLIDCPADTNSKLLLLDENISTGTLEGLPEALQTQVAEREFDVTSHEIHIGYSQLSAADVLKVSSGRTACTRPSLCFLFRSRDVMLEMSRTHA